MNLHKQFLLSCQNLNTISFNDFVKVLKLQRLDFNKEEYEKLYEKFRHQNSKNKNGEPVFLNFPGFIRNFKSILNEKRLNCVESAFEKLDEDKTEMLFTDDIKFKFDVLNHPENLQNKRNEEEILLEFLDCFEMNYTILVK